MRESRYPPPFIKSREEVDLEWGGKLVFLNSVVGGAIDARFMPAILKGIMDCMAQQRGWSLAC